MSILFEIGDFSLYTYSCLMALAVLAGLAVALLGAKRAALRAVDVFDAVLCSAIGGIIGARLEYICLNLEYFREQPGAIWQIGQGGLAYHGALLAGALTLIAYARFKRLSFWSLADALTPGLVLSLSIGWVACLYGGYAYGKMGFGPLYFAWHDLFGVMASRFAVQPLGAGLTFAVFIALWFARPALCRPGALFLLFLFLTGFIHFGLGFGRGDETVLWAGWRVDQWLALGQAAVALGLGVWRKAGRGLEIPG